VAADARHGAQPVWEIIRSAVGDGLAAGRRFHAHAPNQRAALLLRSISLAKLEKDSGGFQWQPDRAPVADIDLELLTLRGRHAGEPEGAKIWNLASAIDLIDQALQPLDIMIPSRRLLDHCSSRIRG
jgi:hypothetical protein